MLSTKSLDYEMVRAVFRSPNLHIQYKHVKLCMIVRHASVVCLCVCICVLHAYPSVSIRSSRLTKTFRAARRRADTVKQLVKVAGRPSGMLAITIVIKLKGECKNIILKKKEVDTLYCGCQQLCMLHFCC